jgi:hypothetical protein
LALAPLNPLAITAYLPQSLWCQFLQKTFANVNELLQAFEPSWDSATLAWQVNLATIANPFIQWPVWTAIHKFGEKNDKIS